MSETTTYPEWQKTIREAQAVEDAKAQARRDKEIEDRRARNEKKLDTLLDILKGFGIDGLPCTINGGESLKVAFNGYTLTEYPNGGRYLRRRVEGAEEKYLDDVEGYWCEVSEAIPYGITAADFADAIDRVDEHAEAHAKRNAEVLARYLEREAKKAEPAPPKQLTPYVGKTFNHMDVMVQWLNDRAAEGYVLKSHQTQTSEGGYAVIMELAEVQS